jgi:uncharacterized protein (DUF1810 family)
MRHVGIGPESGPPLILRNDEAPGADHRSSSGMTKEMTKETTQQMTKGMMRGMTDLTRFVEAQDGIYERALAELRAGEKRSHWMWFVFPQVAGLGRSSTAQRYAIAGLDEARDYLAHPVLGPRLVECSEALLAVEGRDASQIMGYPDDLKLRSSMTLFAEAADDLAPFARVLEKYFDSSPDPATLERL